MKRTLLMLAGLALLGGLSVPAQATLIDRGGGLIYDSNLDLTWINDAELSGGVRVWSDPIGRTGAVEWAEDLVYAGHSNWRLPATLQPDPSCDGQSIYLGTPVSQGFGCTGSELGHLFYNL